MVFDRLMRKIPIALAGHGRSPQSEHHSKTLPWKYKSPPSFEFVSTRRNGSRLRRYARARARNVYRWKNFKRLKSAIVLASCYALLIARKTPILWPRNGDDGPRDARAEEGSPDGVLFGRVCLAEKENTLVCTCRVDIVLCRLSDSSALNGHAGAKQCASSLKAEQWDGR